MQPIYILAIVAFAALHASANTQDDVEDFKKRCLLLNAFKQKLQSQYGGSQQVEYVVEYVYPEEYYQQYPQLYQQQYQDQYLQQFIDSPPGVAYYDVQPEDEYFYYFVNSGGQPGFTGQLQWNDLVTGGQWNEAMLYSDEMGGMPYYFTDRKLKNGGRQRVRIDKRSYTNITKKNLELKTRGMAAAAAKNEQAKREEVVPERKPTAVKVVKVVKRV